MNRHAAPPLRRPLALALVLLGGSAAAQEPTLVAPAPGAAQRRPVPPAGDELVLSVRNVAALTGADELAELDLAPGSVDDAARGRELLAELEDAAAQRARVRASGEALAEVLRSYMEPAFDAAQHQVQLVSEGVLVVHATPAQQAWVDRFLAVQGDAQGTLVDAQAHILFTPPGLLAELGHPGSAAVLSGPGQAQALLDGLRARGDVESVNAPRLLALPRQRASISVTNQVAYVKDYELHLVEPGATEIADPVIDTVWEGLRFEMRAVPLAPQRFGFEVDLTHATLERPIPTKRLLIGAGRHSVTIGLPEVTEVGVRARLVLEDGWTALFVTPDQDAARDVVTLVRLSGVAGTELGLDQLEAEPGDGPPADERRGR